MRILVTGATGFLGKHVVELLTGRYPRALIYAVGSNAVDLTDALDTEAVFVSRRPTHVIHLAARVGGIEANRKHPGTFFRDNMRMGVNVLEAARKCHELPEVLMVGTTCSYPLHARSPLSEDDLWFGYPEPTNAPYGIAKRALLVMAEAYQAEFGLRVKTAILANLYGPGDNFDPDSSHVIPGMIYRIVEAKRLQTPVKLWGDGSPSREFLYVEDAARIIIAMIDRMTPPSSKNVIVNVGSGQTITMKNLAATVARLLEYQGEISWDTAKPNGQPHRVLDCSQLETFWRQPFKPLIEGLKHTIEWYLRNRS